MNGQESRPVSGYDRKCLLVDLLAALQFLTILPPLVRRPFTPQELGRSLSFYPMVGFLIGGLLFAGDWLMRKALPVPVSAALLLVVWVMASGALHLDGLMDAFDGLFGGHSPEARLQIMHDERVGAYGLAAGMLLLVLKYACLLALPEARAALWVAPTLSRWGMILAVVAFPYARPEGLGRQIKDHAGWQQVASGSIFSLVVAVLFTGLAGVGSVMFAAALVLVAGWCCLKRLPGLTGDIFGAINEFLEGAILVWFLGWWSWAG